MSFWHSLIYSAKWPLTYKLIINIHSEIYGAQFNTTWECTPEFPILMSSVD